MSWKIKTALQLGRVSNLPTVWSNVLAGVALAGASPLNGYILPLILAMSLAYIGGMFLNDAFDRKTDATERPERPIPSGAVKAAEVFAAGFTLLIGSVFFAGITAIGWGHNIALVTTLCIALGCTIVLYDVWHKGNLFSPLIMGACRVLVILIAGFAATDQPSIMLFIGAATMLCYLMGLTYVAKQENLGEVKNLWPLLFLLAPIACGVVLAFSDIQVVLPTLILAMWILYALYLIRRRASGDIPKAVVSMIAGISLVDALFIASTSSLYFALLALAAFCTTLALQKFVSGT